MGSGRLDAFEPPTPTGRRAEVLGRLAKSMAALAPDRRIVVAIDGVDGAGKTVLARELVELIRPTDMAQASRACTLYARVLVQGANGEEAMFAAFSDVGRVELTLYTDALIVRGGVRTRQHRVSDILNLSETPYLVLEDVTVTELDGRSEPITADVAQVNLDAVLFAVADTPVAPSPELRAPKMQRAAIISVPPFRVTGTLHLLAGAANLREALTDLTGRFLPVTDAEFQAKALGLGPRPALMVAVNHQRAQILAQYSQPGDRPGESGTAVADPWEGTR